MNDLNYLSPITPARKVGLEYEPSRGLNIGVTPGAIIGALTGGFIAKKNAEKANNQMLMQEQARRMREARENTPTIAGNYYSQVQQVANNLDVIFTPMSVILTVKNAKKTFTLDTIEVCEMNDSMKMAWKNKDSMYFKNLLLTKMMSEMQIAEQGFSKRFIEKKMGIGDILTKKSSDRSFLNDLNTTEMLSLAFKESHFFEGNDTLEKIGAAVCTDFSKNLDTFYIDTHLDRPFEKYAGVLTNITNSIGLTNEDSEQSLRKTKKQLQNPKYVMRNIQVGFFPDRVIYSLNNQLISTLPLLSMNEESYGHFVNQNSKYFKNLFVNNTKQIIKSSSVYEEDNMEKVAAVKSVKKELGNNCLLSSETHPVIIYLYLNEKLGIEWLKYDISVIETIIKRELKIQDDLPPATLNKVIAILMANQSKNVYTNAFTFEKAVFSLCSKPVDFTKIEKENLDIQDFIFAVDVLDRVTPYDDIYDNFSDEVYNYIGDMLSDKNMYICRPTNIIGSPLEPAFMDKLNETLLRYIKDKMTLSCIGTMDREIIFNKCEYIADTSESVLKSVRRSLDNPFKTSLGADGLTEKIMEEKKVISEYRNLILKQVLINLSLDYNLNLYDTAMSAQLDKYSIIRPGGGN